MKVSYVELAEKLIASGVAPKYLKTEQLEADLAATGDADTAARIMALLAIAKG